MPAVPKHWKTTTWEEKAQENPLFAIQTSDEMQSAPADGFPPEMIDSLFARGRRLFRENLLPLLSGGEQLFEYGCGAGRILNAAIEAGYRATGVDISPTMIEHCRRLVPGAAVYDLEEGRQAIADGSADVAYSFAVLQHIGTLSSYVEALGEIARVLRPGGVMSIHLNCLDAETDGRTENYEHHSLHFRPGEDEPFQEHRQCNVSGVRIGRELLVWTLAKGGVSVQSWRPHSSAKPQAVWVTGVKN